MGGWRALLSVVRVLGEKPWRLEAIIRLLAGIFACIFLGSLVLLVIRFTPDKATVNPTIFYTLTGGAAATLIVLLGCVAKPLTLENMKIRAIVAVICANIGLFLAAIAQKESGVVGRETSVVGMIAATLSFQGAAIPMLWLLVRQHGLGLRDGFGLGNSPGQAALLGATAAMAFIPVGLALQFGIANIAKWVFHINLGAQEAVTILRLADSWADCIALGLVAIVLAPLAEEGLFRGLFYPAIKRLGMPKAALWITSVVFALIHFNVLSFLPLLVLAVVLVKLYEKTDNLLSCIVCHATFNAFNFVMLFVFNDLGPKLQAQP